MTVHATTIHGTVTRARTPATERVWLLVVCAAAALVYGNGLGRLPLWRDEVASVDIAARSVPRILAALGRIDVVHGLYYLLLHAVLQVDGSEVAVRMPSLAGAVAAVGLAAELARRVLGVVPATAAAAVMIANPLLSFYAREARPYALGVMLVCAAAFVLLGTAWRWRGPLFVVFAVLTTYMHLFDALALAGRAAPPARGAGGRGRLRGGGRAARRRGGRAGRAGVLGAAADRRRHPVPGRRPGRVDVRGVGGGGAAGRGRRRPGPPPAVGR
jgi:mannosyltransferase